MAASDNFLCEEIIAAGCHSFCYFLPAVIFKYVHELRHEKADGLYVTDNVRNEIAVKLKDSSLIIQKL